MFGIENVEQHVLVNGWSIDFYIKTTNVYVQFDGVYWHGLNKPIDVIKTETAKRSMTIVATYEKDRHQDLWFKENNVRLIRITDQQFMRGEHIDSLGM